MDAVVLSGGKSTRLNAFSIGIDHINKAAIFEHELLRYFNLFKCRKVYFLGWEQDNKNENGFEDNAVYYKNIYKKYNVEGSFQELLTLIKDTDLMPPFFLCYGDVLPIYSKSDDEYARDMMSKYKTLATLGYSIIMHVANVLFDYEDGNVVIDGKKPLITSYGLKPSSWIDAGMFYIAAINTKSKARSWSDYIKEQVLERRVGYVLVDRPLEINTPYSLYLSNLKTCMK